MSEIINKDNERIIRLFSFLNKISSRLERLATNYKPTLGGERYLTDKEVSERLKISRRTLQEWRTNGQISYITLGGKILYQESDIQKMLEKNRQKAWK